MNNPSSDVPLTVCAASPGYRPRLKSLRAVAAYGSTSCVDPVASSFHASISHAAQDMNTKQQVTKPQEERPAPGDTSRPIVDEHDHAGIAHPVQDDSEKPRPREHARYLGRPVEVGSRARDRMRRKRLGRASSARVCRPVHRLPSGSGTRRSHALLRDARADRRHRAASRSDS